MNPPSKSKINWTAAITAVIGIAAAFDLIPADLEEHLVELVIILSPTLVFIYRTWFTEKQEEPPEPWDVQ